MKELTAVEVDQVSGGNAGVIIIGLIALAALLYAKPAY